MVNRRPEILNGLAAHNCPLEVEASANNFLYTPSFLPKETLEPLLHFMQRTFQKNRAASTAMEKKIWSPIVNSGDECQDRKVFKEGRMRYTSMSHLLIGHLECVDSEKPCSTALVFGMADVFDGLG